MPYLFLFPSSYLPRLPLTFSPSPILLFSSSPPLHPFKPSSSVDPETAGARARGLPLHTPYLKATCWHSHVTVLPSGWESKGGVFGGKRGKEKRKGGRETKRKEKEGEVTQRKEKRGVGNTKKRGEKEHKEKKGGEESSTEIRGSFLRPRKKPALVVDEPIASTFFSFVNLNASVPRMKTWHCGNGEEKGGSTAQGPPSPLPTFLFK